eukprot:4887232-Amphidinium_carterae.2
MGLAVLVECAVQESVHQPFQAQVAADIAALRAAEEQAAKVATEEVRVQVEDMRRLKEDMRRQLADNTSRATEAASSAAAAAVEVASCSLVLNSTLKQPSKLVTLTTDKLCQKHTAWLYSAQSKQEEKIFRTNWEAPLGPHILLHVHDNEAGKSYKKRKRSRRGKTIDKKPMHIDAI